MRDPAPLSQRFDLAYVRRRWWPWRWGLGLSVLLGGAAAVWATITLVRGDERAFTSGTVTHAHSFIANDCAACHQPDPQRSGYWLPAADAACIQCHAVAAHPDPHAGLFTGQEIAGVVMSSNCAACHVEHRGAQHDLKRLDDRFCVQCHGDLDAYEARGAWHGPSPHRGGPRRVDFHALAAAKEVTP
jgi:predicted CXXCH cytochrome family protein